MTAISELGGVGSKGLAGRQPRQQRLDELLRVPSRLAEAAAQQLPQADADAELGSCQTVELRLAPIAQDQALLGIEHRQPLGHVVERGIKLQVLRRQLALLL